jgi:hypothetical protein
MASMDALRSERTADASVTHMINSTRQHRAIKPGTNEGTSVTYQSMPFSDEWWNEFLLETKSLNSPAVFGKVIDQVRIASYQRAVLNIVATLCELRTAEYGFRAYLDGHLLGGDGMEMIYDHPPLPDESLEQWAEREFQDKRFGFIVNSGEKFHEAFSKDIALLMAPLLKKVGIPRDGIQFTLFIGNYDKTPLGIHQDIRGENVTHFHAGPGSKLMYVWDKDQYKKLTTEGGLKPRDFPALRPYAKRFLVEAGDLFFMPEGTFHIGAQDEISIGITVWQYTHTNKRFAQVMLNHAFKQIKTADDDAIVHDSTPPDDVGNIEDILATQTIPHEFKGLGFGGLLKSAYVDWRHSIFSNAGYRNPPFQRKQREPFGRNDTVQLESPYKILIREIDGTGKMIVYVRGHKLEMNHHTCLIDLVDRLNDGQVHSVSELLDMLDKSWSEKVGIYLLSELDLYHGISKTQREVA